MANYLQPEEPIISVHVSKDEDLDRWGYPSHYRWVVRLCRNNDKETVHWIACTDWRWMSFCFVDIPVEMSREQAEDLVQQYQRWATAPPVVLEDATVEIIFLHGGSA